MQPCRGIIWWLIEDDEGSAGASASALFKTIGFGALWNVFQTVFSLTLKNYSGFTTKDVVSILKRIDTFDFNALLEYGTGNAAEVTAGE